MSPWLLPAVAVMTGLIAAVTDLRTGRIPNWLTLSASILGVVGSGISQGVRGLVLSLLGAVFCGAVPGIVYKASAGRGIGGGDIKLFIALGALLGPTQGLEAELSAFLLLGLFALFRLAFLGQLGRTLITSLRVTIGFAIPRLRLTGTELDSPMTAMRMGPAIAVATVTVLGLPYITKWLPWLG